MIPLFVHVQAMARKASAAARWLVCQALATAGGWTMLPYKSRRLVINSHTNTEARFGLPRNGVGSFFSQVPIHTRHHREATTSRLCPRNARGAGMLFTLRRLYREFLDALRDGRLVAIIPSTAAAFSGSTWMHCWRSRFGRTTSGRWARDGKQFRLGRSEARLGHFSKDDGRLTVKALD